LIHGLLGSALARLGDMPGGIAGWDEALASARSMGDRYGEAQTLWGRGRTHAHQEEWTQALPDLDRSVELLAEMGAEPSLARALQDRAHALRGLGRTADAAADEQRSLNLGRHLGLRDKPFA
jgi:tetratricopeptide (TPR) repeat protein